MYEGFLIIHIALSILVLATMWGFVLLDLSPSLESLLIIVQSYLSI